MCVINEAHMSLREYSGIPYPLVNVSVEVTLMVPPGRQWRIGRSSAHLSTAVPGIQ